jgi:type IV pilus assembly protein PilW
MSLLELIIALTIGLLLLSGLATIFASSSDANRELQKTAAQIENGRFAIETLVQDLRLAGFYGHLHDMSDITVPAAVPPDPCQTASAAELLKNLWFPVQGYTGTIDATTPASDTRPVITSTSCGALLTNANLKPGSDILVVRRADTNPLAAADVATSNVYYVQASSSGAEVQVGGGIAVGSKKADGVTDSTLKLTNGSSPAPSAPIRKLRVHVYFVAPCSIGQGRERGMHGRVGRGYDPDAEAPRAERRGRDDHRASGRGRRLPEARVRRGYHAEYGQRGNGYKGDATVDSYTTAPADWTTVIAAKVYVLARNTQATRDYVDNKSYALGSATAPARNDGYKRHVFSALAQLVNPAGRREIP